MAVVGTCGNSWAGINTVAAVEEFAVQSFLPLPPFHNTQGNATANSHHSIPLLITSYHFLIRQGRPKRWGSKGFKLKVCKRKKQSPRLTPNLEEARCKRSGHAEATGLWIWSTGSEKIRYIVKVNTARRRGSWGCSSFTSGSSGSQLRCLHHCLVILDEAGMPFESGQRVAMRKTANFQVWPCLCPKTAGIGHSNPRGPECRRSSDGKWDGINLKGVFLTVLGQFPCLLGLMVTLHTDFKFCWPDFIHSFAVWK